MVAHAHTKEAWTPASVNGVRQLEVHGRDLVLRFPNHKDARSLFALGSDPDVTRFFSWGPYQDEHEATAYIAGLTTKRREGERLEFVIEHRTRGVIGVTGLSEFCLRNQRAVTGSWLGRRWWGTGANRQSKALLLSLAFRGLGLGRVTAWCGCNNQRSQKALERLGFVHESVLRHWHVHAGEPKDVISYSMLRSEWEASDLAQEPAEIFGGMPKSFVR